MGIRLDNARSLYLEAIRDGNFMEAINKYAGDRYTQHSTPVRDGKDGFIEFFSDFVQRNPEREIEIVRAFEDGRYVFLHVVQHLNGGESRWVTADIFDTDEAGRLVEHWDIIDELVEESVSGHSQVDGSTEPRDLELTDQNKELVLAFVNRVLKDGDLDRLTDFVSTEQYIQHNPRIGDGLDGLAAFLDSLAAEGQTMSYQQVHRAVGSGDMVAVLSEMELGGAPMAVIDLFRVEDRRIVEHWDVMEEILPRNQWVNSGKF